MEILKELYWGKIGLVRTYWLYGVVSWILFAVAIGAVSSIKWLTYLTLGFRVIYMIFIFGAIWNSAKNYTGRYIWAVFARLSVLYGILLLIVSTIEIIGKLR